MRAGHVPSPAPEVSIVVATCRRGGLDMLVRTCADQRMTDSELVLVDYFWQERREVMAAKWAAAGLAPERLVHVPPRKRQAFHDSHQAYNTGLALARGRLVCLLADYIYGPPDWLQAHLRVAEATDWRGFLCGPHRLFRPPPMECVKDPGHVADYTAFDHDFSPDDFKVQTQASYKPPGRVTPWQLGPVTLWEVPVGHFHGTANEAASLEALYAINGFDEEFDGGRGFGDLDVGARLVKAGYTPCCYVNAPATLGFDHRTAEFPAALTLQGRLVDPSKASENLYHQRRFVSWFRAKNDGFDIAAPFTPEDAVAGWGG